MDVKYSSGSLETERGCGEGLGRLGQIPYSKSPRTRGKSTLLFERHERWRNSAWRRCGRWRRGGVDDRDGVGGST